MTKSVKDENKSKALESALAAIRKDFGNEAIMLLGSKQIARKIDVIPTGILPVDIATGVGGFPRGRVIEIFGPESSGKTTMALCAVGQAQKAGGIAAYIDAEHALDPGYAKILGVQVEDLLLSQPDSGEQALQIAEKLACSGAVDIVVIDSVAALVPQAEINGDMGDTHVGLQARLMSQALRKLTSVISKSRTSFIFLNQLRQKVGVFYGANETTPGGLALKFYSSVRIDLRPSEKIKNGDEIVGQKVKVKIIKNKVACPFKTGVYETRFGMGIDLAAALLDMAEEAKLIEKSGTWYLFGSERLGQGRENSAEALRSNPQLYSKIETELKTLLLPLEEPDGVASASEKNAA